MNRTRETLIRRLRDRDDRTAWEQFFALYAPLIYRFARSRGLAVADAEEVRDHCLEVVARKMPDFEYDKRQSFRSWLYTIANGRVIDVARRGRLRRVETGRMETGDLRDVADATTDPAQVWDARWREEHLAYCLARARFRVSSLNYRAFELLLFRGRTVPEVCAELSMNENQVYKAKMRTLKAIRATMAQLDAE